MRHAAPRVGVGILKPARSNSGQGPERSPRNRPLFSRGRRGGSRSHGALEGSSRGGGRGNHLNALQLASRRHLSAHALNVVMPRRAVYWPVSHVVVRHPPLLPKPKKSHGTWYFSRVGAFAQTLLLRRKYGNRCMRSHKREMNICDLYKSRYTGDFDKTIPIYISLRTTPPLTTRRLTCSR